MNINNYTRHLFIIISTICYFSLTLSSALAETYRFNHLWPDLQQPWYFSEPGKLVFDSDDKLYIADSGNNRIQVFTKNGSFVRTIGAFGDGQGEFDWPRGVAVSTAGLMYVADTANHRIQVFSQDAVYLTSWGQEGIEEGRFSFPSGIAVDENGEVYVTDSENNRIQVFDSEGGFIRSWGSEGSGNGQLNTPSDLIIANNNQVYVADTDNHRIAVFSSKGKFIKNFSRLGSGDGELEDPTGITYSKADNVLFITSQGGNKVFAHSKIQVFSVEGEFIKVFKDGAIDESLFDGLYSVALADDGSVYVTEQWSARVQVFNINAQTTQLWQAFGQGDKQFLNAKGMTLDESGKVYIADTDNSSVKIFDHSGKFLSSWGNQRDDNSDNMAGPAFLAFANKELYITDTYADKILVLDHNGKIIRSWGSAGSDFGQFNQPSGIAISRSGLVYVADSKNHRIQVFSTQGKYIRSWGTLGQNDGEFTNPVGVAVSPDGEVYVTETALEDSNLAFIENHRVQVFTAEGVFKRKWGGTGTGKGNNELFFPTSIKLFNDQVYISDTRNHRIQVFSTSGEWLSTIGEFGVGNGQFNLPIGIALDSVSLFVVDAQNFRVQKFNKETGDYGTDINNQALKHPFKAIILAGGGPSNGNYINHIWDATQMLANRAYSTLRSQGFNKQEISYLSPVTRMDLDNNGVFDDIEMASLKNLEQAILDAKDAKDVLLYLIDHGGPGKFQVTPGEVLSADQLKLWLGQLQDTIPGHVAVIIESCKSGSFIPALTHKKRFILASSAATQASVISNKGFNAFSYYFWNEVRAGAILQDAFKAAKQGMSGQLINGRPQNAQLDSNADGKFDNDDFIELANYCLGNCTQFAASLPEITNKTEDSTLNGDQVLALSMHVSSLEPILSAWAVILRPDYYHPDSDEPISDLPIVPLNCSDTGLCTGSYEKFNITGDYQISFHAQDALYQMALPLSSIVTQQRSEQAVYDEIFGLLTLSDVLVGQSHYRVELLNIGNFNFVLKGEIQGLEATTSMQPAEYNVNTMQLSIPKAQALGRNYQLLMQHSGDFVFTIQSFNELE